MTHEPFTTATELLTRIGTALEAENWTRLAPLSPPQNVAVGIWTSPDRTAQLLLTSGPDEPPIADLSGHAAGHPDVEPWSLCATDPSEVQVLAASRAAADVRPDTPEHHAGRFGDILRTIERLQRAGWSLHCDDAGSGVLFRLSRADGGRDVIRIDDDADQPGGWMLEGRNLRADATGGTPTAVLAALALTLP